MILQHFEHTSLRKEARGVSEKVSDDSLRMGNMLYKDVVDTDRLGLLVYEILIPAFKA